MAYEKRDGDIAIFLESEKRNERGPDWRGTALIDGVKYEVALWAKGGRGTMLAGQIKVAQARDDFRSGSRGGGGDPGGLPRGDRQVAERGFDADLDDEIPF